MTCREAQIADLQYMITRHTAQSVHLFTQLELTDQDQTNNRKNKDHSSQSMLRRHFRFKSVTLHDSFQSHLLYSSLPWQRHYSQEFLQVQKKTTIWRPKT